MMLPDLRGIKCRPAARQITNNELRLTLSTCKVRDRYRVKTHLIPLVIRHVYRVFPLEHSTIVDEDIDMIHNCQSAIYHLSRILPVGKIAGDDIGLHA